MRKIVKWFKRLLDVYALLPDYFHTIAQQWQNILGGAGLLAIAWVVWSGLGNPPISAKVTIIVIALFLAGYYAWRVERLRLIPKVEFGNPRVIPTPTTTAETGESGPKRIVGQVLVRLRSPDVPVHNATGQLLRVWRCSPKDDDWILTEADEPLDLLWSVVDQPFRTLNSDQQLCVFFIDENNPHIRIWTDRVTLRTERLFEDSARDDIYKFDISVRGENCPPVYISLKVQLGDRWNNPTFEAITENLHST